MAQAVNMGTSHGNSIVPDGRTATTLSVHGSVTNIRTSTFSGGNAYNSFSTFSEASGNTVNLVVPKTANNLVNVVRNGAVNIQGALNSYKNGKIGGNVVFADSYGFVVGASGSINVGSLTVITPSKATIDGLIDASGHVNNALAAQMITGNVPLSADGSVIIRGAINAQHFVKITAQDVRVAGSMEAATRTAMHRAQFESTVNAKGLVEGGSIVAHNGSISIVAAHNATIGGTLSASGNIHHAGSVTVTAQNNLNVTSTAKITASSTNVAPASVTSKAASKQATSTSASAGTSSTSAPGPAVNLGAGNTATIAGLVTAAAAKTGAAGTISVTGTTINVASTAQFVAQGTDTQNGGTISIKAVGTTNVAAGATFTANALGSGTGGLVELSGAVDQIDPSIVINLGSKSGTAGTLLFDPDDLIIGSTNNGSQGDSPIVGGTGSTLASLYTNGANVELDATNSITINGVIDTREYTGDTVSATQVTGLLSAHSTASTGNSGSITLNAPSITLNSGSGLYADVNNVGNTSYTAGNVTLTASTTDNEVAGISSATDSITINGTITGYNISANVTSIASSSVDSLAGFAYLPANTVAASLIGLDGSYVGSTASAILTLQQHANIQATGSVTLSSSGSETAADPIIVIASIIPQNPLAAGVVVGKVSGTVTTEVQSGATISSGSSLNVTASNDATMSVNAQVYTFSGSSLDATVAYSTGSVTTQALIDSGAVISSAPSIKLTSQNTNNFSTEASSLAGGNAQAGVSVAISDISTSSTANLGASIPNSAQMASLVIFSGSNTTANVVQSSTTVGSNFLLTGISSAAQSISAPISMFFGSGSSLGGTAAGAAMAAQGTSTYVPKGGLALTLNLSSASSTASIDGGTGNTAPTIYSNGGNVAVVSILTDAGIRNDAETTINSNSYDPTVNDPGTSSSLALAVAVAQITHSSNAYIGEGVHLTAGFVGVDAQTSVPITNSWGTFDDFSTVTSHFNANGGVVNDILTSYANATSSSSNLGIAGAVNYFDIQNNTTAWIANTAYVTQTNVASSGSVLTWSSTFSVADGTSSASQTVNWAGGLAVTASTQTQSIDVGGNFNWLLFLGGSNSSSPTGTAVGGSASVDVSSSTTLAGIGAGAVITADGGLAVGATTQDLVYSVAPTSGLGSGLAGNGIASVVLIDNTTTASISSQASITASAVLLNAEQDVSSFSVAGSVGASTGGGVGIAVALADIDTNTSAIIGTSTSSDDRGLGSIYSGYVYTGALDVTALTDGRLTAVSVAAEYTNNTIPLNAPAPVQSMAPSGSNTGTFVATWVASKFTGLWQKVTTAVTNVAASNPNTSAGTTSVAGAGSTSVNLTTIDTTASISGATIKPQNSGNTGNSVSIQALNNTIIDTASGAAALAKGAPGTNYTVGIAGAIAIDISTDVTTATITGSHVTADNVATQALAGGENTVVGLAVALTSGGGFGSTTAVSASVSVADINEGVNASIDSSVLSGTTSSASGAVSISADQNTNIGIGAGSLASTTGFTIGGGGSLGIALTYAQIGDASNVDGVSATMSNSSVQDYGSLNIEALDQSRIISGAAVVAGGPTNSGFEGAVVVNEITPTIVAEIVGAPAVVGTAAITGGITIYGDVNVIAGDGTNSTLENLISNAKIANTGGLASSGGGTGADDSHLDFTAAALSPTSSTGAAILAVAGQVGAGKSNVGISLVINQIAQTTEALIDTSSVTSTNGIVNVAATNDAEILGVAFGVSAGYGSVVGLGSIVYNSITDGVTAQIGHEDTTSGTFAAAAATVSAGAIRVYAEDGSDIRGATGAIAVNVGGSDAIGLSMTIDQISNYVVAQIAGGDVSANQQVSDSSPLLSQPLTTGSLLVSGVSNANITSISIGTAVSVGNNPTGTPNATPAQNLATLVAGLKPSAPTALASRGGSAAYFNVSPPTPPPPSGPPSDGLAGAGSVVVSTEASTITSDIGQGALEVNSDINANNNVIVEATNSETIKAYSGALSIAAGSGNGIGASIVVSEISATTSAYIDRSTVDAHATGGTASVDNGTLTSSPNPSTYVTPGSTPSFTDGVNYINGLAIIATSDESVTTVAVVASVSNSGSAVSANSITDTMGGTTQAYASNSNLNTLLTSGQISAIQVTAASEAFANNLDIGGALGSSASGTVAIVVNTMNAATNASINSSTVGSSSYSAGSVAILANAWEGTSGEAIGVSASDTFGVAGSALVNLFSAQTAATFIGGTNYAASLAVNANTTDGYSGAVGTGSFGTNGALGAGVLVAIIGNTTTAIVGDTSDTTSTGLNLSGALTVGATTSTNASGNDMGVSIGGDAGVAAMISYDELTNQTTAKLADTTVTTASSANANGSVSVTTSEKATIDPNTGALAGGGAGGIGASANVVILKSVNTAQMSADTLTVPGAVTVSATSQRTVNAVDVTAGLGGDLGLAATVGVVLVGTAASSDETGVINEGGSGTLASADAVAGTNGSLVASLGAGTACLTGGSSDCTSASIQGGTVNAGSVSITATGQTSILNVVGSLAVGGAAGFGAAIGYTQLDQTVAASATGGTINAANLTIAATAGDRSGHAAETVAVAGAGGLYFGLGAAVGYSTVSDNVTAQLSSTVNGGTNGTGSAAITAGDTSSILSDAYGFAGGAGAVGASIAYAVKSSTVDANIQPSTTLSNLGAVMVMASGTGSVTSYTIAGAAGIVAGSGAASTSTDSETITAYIGASSSVTTNGAGVLVDASAAPDLSASSIGVAAGGAAVGVSVAMATASVNVKAYVDDGTTIAGDGSLTITAIATQSGSSDIANANAVAGSGGTLLGLQATLAQAADTSNVTAYGGTGLHLPTANVTITAENDSDQYASTTGVAVGYIAAGASVAQTSSDTTTKAYLNPGAVTASSNTGVLTITASGNDINTSDALAGSGGVLAGAAAVATTSTTDTLSATLYGSSTYNTMYFGGLDISATHTTTFSATGDAFQASEVGASGGNATNTVLSNVTAEVGTNLIINSAAGDMDVKSSDTVTETSGGARAGSGGVAAGAATVSGSNITQNVTTNIDSGTVFSLNDDPSTSTAKIDIEAFNALTTTDNVNLIAGGLFAGGGAQSNLTANATLVININNNVELFSAGTIYIGTASEMTSNNNANANLYGVVTGAGASTNSTLNAKQTVNIDEGAVIEGWGIVNVFAGESGTAQLYSLVSANATTTVYNEALIPITATYSGAATATDYAILNLADESQILSVNNVSIAATGGTVVAAGNGTNYNPYLSLFSTDNHSNNSTMTGNGTINMYGGIVAAGIHNQAIITIAYGGAVSILPSELTYGLTFQYVANVSDFNPIMSYNNQAIQYTIISGFNPYQQIVNQLATLSGLTASQVTSDINSQTQITAINDDAAGDVQRQINTLVQQAAFATNATGNSVAFGNILVSAGNVSVMADTVTGSQGSNTHGDIPTISANNSAKIDIENQDVTFLDLSKLTITGVTGGNINFTGAAAALSDPYIREVPDLSATTPSITVNASYAGQINNFGVTQVVTSTGTVLSTTPDIYFDADVVNVNGVITVNNQLGSVVIASQNFDGATIQMSVPNGNLTVNAGAGSIYSSNGAVASQFSSDEYRPTNAITAVDAAATYIESWALNYYHDDGGNSIYAPISQYGSSASTIFTARLLAKYYNGSSLQSDIFLPAGGSNGGENAAWERHNYQGQAYDANDSGPINCSGCGSFFTVINVQTLNYTAATAPVTPAPVIIGGAIILSASYLNINGTLESGHSSSYSASIGSTAAAQIAAIENNPTTLAADAGKLIPLTTTAINGSDTKINAVFDVSNDQIILQNVVQGAGGYIYLNGKIISTSTSGSSQGNLIVNGGYGTVNVQNTTGTQLVVNTINTGASTNNVIEIVDQNKQATTWYVYNAASGNVNTYTQNGVNNTNYLTANFQGTYANSGLTYQPVANQLYEWVDTANLTRSVTVTNSSNDAQTTNPWTFTYVNSPEYPYTETTSIVSGSQSTNYAESVTATGSYVTTSFGTGSGKCCGADFNGQWTQNLYDSVTLTLINTVKASNAINISFDAGTSSSVTVNSNASILVQGSITNQNGSTTLTATGANSAITAGANGFISGQSVTLSAPGGIGTQAAPVSVQVYNGTLSANATDHDIAIAANGALSVSHVIVSPTVSGAAPQGNIYLSATGDITSATTYNPSTPIIIGKSIEIDTTGGAVGAVTTGSGTLGSINPIVIEATATVLNNGSTDGGLLNSSTANGAYIIQSTGNLLLGSITSNGPVFLEAAASNNGQTANILNGISSGGLTTAQTTYLTNVWTNLSLQSGAGSIAVTSYQNMINAAYADYWQMRNLAFADGTDYVITPLGSTVIATQLAASLNVPVSSISTTQIQAAATSRYEQDEYLLGLVTPAQLGVSLDTLFGTASGQTVNFQAAPTTAALTTALTTYNSGFSYVLPTTSSLYTAMTAQSTWSIDQLTYTVSASANPASNTPPPSIVSLPLNISARDVMLYAPTGSIGSLAAPATFSFTSTDDSSLTAADKALLTTAGAGQLQVTATTLANGVTQYNISVQQESLVIVSPLGPVAAKAETNIYLGSATNMNIGGISSATFGPVSASVTQGIQTTGTGSTGGTVRLEAVDSILGLSNQVAISGNIASLTLIADTGSIGAAASTAGTNPATNPNALLLALTGTTVGQIDQASAAQGIYLRQTTGDLVLGNVTDTGSGANGTVQLAASGSIYAEAQLTDRTAPHIIGTSLDLRAGGNISYNGSSYQPLQVEISGAVTGYAAGTAANSTGNLTILGVVGDLTIGSSGTYGSLTSAGAVILNSTTGNLNIDATVTSASSLELQASEAVSIAAGTSQTPLVISSTNGAVTLISGTLSMGAYSNLDAAGEILVATTGNATLGELYSTMTAATANTGAPAISVSAGGVATTGAILSNGDGRENIVATGTNGSVYLSASGDIGSSTHALAVDETLLAVSSTGGNVYLSSINALHINTGNATLGSMTITGTALLTLDTITTGGVFTATSTAGAIALGSATSGGTQTIEANKALTYTTLKTTAGDIDLTSDTLSITGNASSDTLEAYGSFNLNAMTTITGTSLKADTGSGFVKTAGLITLGTTTTDTTLQVTSTGDAVALTSATSGGTQTIEANKALTYTTLKTTAGDIDLTSDTTSITGNASSDTLEAYGSFNLNAMTTIAGTSLKADTGSGFVKTAGLITLGTTTTGTTLQVTSTGDAITLGTAASGGTQTIEANKALTYTTLKTTAGDIDLTSDTLSITGNASSDTLEAYGSFNLNAMTTITGTSLKADTGSGFVKTAGLITLGTTTTGTTLQVTSTGDAITLGTATSGGTQTIGSNGILAFTTLTSTGGDINATSSSASINGVTASAHGSADLAAYINNTGTTLTTQTGSATLIATTGDITWQTLNVATTFNATAFSGAIGLGSANSGGTQTIDAHNALTYTTLKTNGVGSDIGNIYLTSRTSSITGTGLDARGSFNLNAASTITANSLQADTGSGLVNAGDAINVGTTTVATSLGMTSNGSTITLGTATSGGSQTYFANGNIQFALLQTSGIPGDAGDVAITSNSSIIGGSIFANGFVTTNSNGFSFDQINAGAGLSLSSNGDLSGNALQTSGSLTLSANNSINFQTIKAGSASLSSHNTINIDTMTVATSANFATQNLNVNFLQQSGSGQGPLFLTITGYAGSIGDNANFGYIDAPNGLIIPVLREDPVTINTSAQQISIYDAVLTGTMRLTTPTQTLWFNDVSSQPVLGNNVQFFQRGYEFYLYQDGNSTTTNSYVVQFNGTASIHESINGVPYDGISFIRNIDQQTYVGNSDNALAFPGSDTQPQWSFPVDAFDQHLRGLDMRLLASANGDSTVVNLGETYQNDTTLSPGFEIVFKRKRH